VRIFPALSLVVGCLIVSGTPWPAHAQAWVPGPGEGTATLSYQFTRVKKHLFSQNIEGLTIPGLPYVGGPGNTAYLGDIFGQNVSLSGEYGLWPGLAASAEIIYSAGRYNGLYIEDPIDDDTYHGALQDLVVSLRYMNRWNGFAITPIVGARIPTNDYASVGHAAVGRGLNEFSLGVYAGRSMAPWWPAVFAQAGYVRGFVENLTVDGEDLSLDRNRISSDIGLLLTPAVTVGGSYSFENAVDGVDWLEETSLEVHEVHDKAAKDVVHRVGGFVSWFALPNAGVSLAFQAIVAGENTHDAKTVAVSTTWRFRGPSF